MPFVQVQEASNYPVRELAKVYGSIEGLEEDAIRPINIHDFRRAVKNVRATHVLV